MEEEEAGQTAGEEELASLPPDTQTSIPDSDSERKIKMDETSTEKLASQPESLVDNEDTAAEEDGEGTASENPPEVAECSRPHSTSSNVRTKSSSSGDIIFEAKKKKKGKGSSTPGDAYTVTFTVSIAMAIPTEDYVCEFLPPATSVEEEDLPDLKELLKKKKRVIEAPRAQNYYHVEYYLIPGDEELMKTDVVTYGMAAKLYMERHDARVIKTWQDGEITWIAWAHSHTMTVTKEILLKMYSHTLELRIWDTKDKCSTRARFDRPKAFRMPMPKPGESPEAVGGVKAMVIKQMAGFYKMQSPKAEAVRPLPQRCTFPRADTKKRVATMSQARAESASGAKTLVAVPNKANSGKSGGRSFSRLGKLAGAERPMQSPAGSAAVKDMILPEDSATVHWRLRKTEAATSAAAERAKKFGICMVPFSMALLFSGTQSITSRLQQPVSGMEDLFVTVSLDQPLLSEELKRVLNPMIITIKSITNLPNAPLSYDKLRSKCQPVYCKYEFFRQPSHTTVAKEHARNIYWDDKHVTLLGTLEESELREYLSGRAMMVEVHDRDRKSEEVKLKATLFGDDLEDEKISNVGTVASRRTLHNAFQGRDKPWDPYGVCSVDLSELLLGHQFLQLSLPVHNCPLPDLLGLDVSKPGAAKKLMGVAGAVDGPVDRPLSSGGYMKAGTLLKIQVELAIPLVTPAQLAAKEDKPSTIQCPFGRIVFIFAYKNTAFLHQLQELIMYINTIALDLDDMPKHVVDAALSTYKLSIEQQRSGTLDIVTGFHVLDKVKHIFVLEGLRDKAIRFLWEELPTPENSDVRVLYNSDLSFSQRLYGALDVDLCRVKLHEPLELLVRQSLLYVRDMVPRPCFLALIRLEELTRMHLMKNMVKNDMFPTSDMVVSMSKEFGVPFTAEDFEELRPDSEKIPAQLCAERTAEMPGVMMRTSREWTPIDNFNKTFVDSIAERKDKSTQIDFVSENKELVKRTSDVNVMMKKTTKVSMVKADVALAHNYSTQTLNSTELANQAVRQLLQQKPENRFTRSQTFEHSGTVVPVDMVALAKEEAEKSRALWRTPTGWIYPGKRSMIQSNIHPRRPDPARVEELQEKWRENILHVSELQPTLDRDRYPWDYRRLDLDLYTRPPPHFQEEPLSIHLPGVKLAAEKTEAKKKEAVEWQSHVVVDDIALHVHRILPQTEMTNRGFYSSNQIDRLTCLLKDQPYKLSLKRTHVRDIPPLSVVHYPAVDMFARAKGLSLRPAIPGEGEEKVTGYKPGPFLLSSWTMEDNHVPAHVYHHGMHAERHSKDFDPLHREHQLLWKRPIVPLREAERDSHLFHFPLASLSQRDALPALGAMARNLVTTVEVGTMTQDMPYLPMKERGLVYV